MSKHVEGIERDDAQELVSVHDVAALIDHTLLKADATRQEIEKLCKEAREFGFATVCVNPTWVALCARLLRREADSAAGP